MGFNEFDDFHGGLESHGCRGLLVTQDLSKSVECEAGEVAEFVDEAFRAVVAGGQAGAGEAGMFWFQWMVERWMPAALAAAEIDWPATRACNTCC